MSPDAAVEFVEYLIPADPSVKVLIGTQFTVVVPLSKLIANRSVPKVVVVAAFGIAILPNLRPFVIRLEETNGLPPNIGAFQSSDSI
jgi:hypothetical protein